MKPEIEAKFCDIDIASMRQRLEEAGAILEQPMRLMRRALMETKAMREENAFLRLRDEGDKVTLTYKKFTGNQVASALEHEVTVSDFGATKQLLELCGLTFHTYQESRRETWKLRDAEVVIDEWPWIPPYIEVEGDTEDAVRYVASRLGQDWEMAVFGGVDNIYERLYDFSEGVRGVIDVAEVRFGEPLPPSFMTK